MHQTKYVLHSASFLPDLRGRCIPLLEWDNPRHIQWAPGATCMGVAPSFPLLCAASQDSCGRTVRGWYRCSVVPQCGRCRVDVNAKRSALWQRVLLSTIAAVGGPAASHHDSVPLALQTPPLPARAQTGGPGPGPTVGPTRVLDWRIGPQPAPEEGAWARHQGDVSELCGGGCSKELGPGRSRHGRRPPATAATITSIEPPHPTSHTRPGASKGRRPPPRANSLDDCRPSVAS